jgi:hypothetical protein
MSFQSQYEGKPVLSWVIDDWEQFFEAMKIQEPNFNFQNFVNVYKQVDYNDGIRFLFENSPIKMNLGGETEKSKLVATDKPMGVFDFSLASMGMYKVPEYYSEKLAKEFPDKFKELELPSGVVPSDLITQSMLPNGENKYVYIDEGKEFDCIIQQKGEAAIEQGVKGATKKYATTNKKVYLTFKKNKGKVKYVEIYSLFYFQVLGKPNQLNTNLEFAVRHIPALMITEYLESIGVKTRFYMTRFVELFQDVLELREFTDSGIELPLYKLAPNKENENNLFIQPIIAKEFGEEFDKALALSISQSNNRKVYEIMAEYALSKEVVGAVDTFRGNRRLKKPTVYGQPNFTQAEYREGFERYRNKYQEYVKLGLYKSKEVLPQAMLFFHDIVIADKFHPFMESIAVYFDKFRNGNPQEAEILIDNNVNPFFVWWMRLSANGLKHKIDLINSNELKKDLISIEQDLYRFKAELGEIVKNTPQPIGTNFKNGRGSLSLIDYYTSFGNEILREYDIIDSSFNISFKKYIYNIITEITTYAEGIFFETPKDRQETMDDLIKSIQQALKDI